MMRNSEAAKLKLDTHQERVGRLYQSRLNRYALLRLYRTFVVVAVRQSAEKLLKAFQAKPQYRDWQKEFCQ